MRCLSAQIDRDTYEKEHFKLLKFAQVVLNA